MRKYGTEEDGYVNALEGSEQGFMKVAKAMMSQEFYGNGGSLILVLYGRAISRWTSSVPTKEFPEASHPTVLLVSYAIMASCTAAVGESLHRNLSALYSCHRGDKLGQVFFLAYPAWGFNTSSG